MSDLWGDDPTTNDFAITDEEAVSGFLFSEERDTMEALRESEPTSDAGGDDGTTDDRPRDELGRFTSSDPTEEEVESPPQEQELILGKFRSSDDVVNAYSHLESYAGRMSSEINELRQRLASIESQKQEPQAPAYSNDDWDELIAENPAVAADRALENEDPIRLQQAMAAWNELAPGAPDLWLDNKRLRNRVLSFEQRVAPAIEQIESARVQNEAAHAFATVMQQYPDFDQYRDEMMMMVGEIAQGGNPVFSQVLEHGTFNQRVRVLDDLYHAARSRKAGDFRAASEAAARQSAQESVQAKQEAQLLSASSSHGAQPSPADLLGSQWDELDAPLTDGWLTGLR